MRNSSYRHRQPIAFGWHSSAEPLENHQTTSTSGTSALVAAQQSEAGYKYGHRSPPAFERVSQWERRHPLEDSIYTPQTARRPRNKAEREITRQLPLWQPVELGSTWRETSTKVGTPPPGADCENTSYVNPQRENIFVSLLSEDVRYAIYEEYLALPAENARWSFSPLNYKARYEDERGIAHPQERSRTTLLLCCRKLYLEARPCFLRLLKNAKMVDLAPRFLPWSMPSSNLASIRSLSWHFFFGCGPEKYVQCSLAGGTDQGAGQLRTHTSRFEYAAAWDVVLAHMPCLQEPRFRGYLPSPRVQSTTMAIYAIHEAKLLEPLRRAQEARQNGGHRVKRYGTFNLRRLVLELHWPSRRDKHAEWQEILKEQWRAFVTTHYQSAKSRRAVREMLQYAAKTRDAPQCFGGSTVPNTPEDQEGAGDAETEHDEDAHILLSQPEARSLTDILAAPGCEVVVKHLFARRLNDLQQRYCGQFMNWYLDPVYVKKLKAGMREVGRFNGEETFVTAWNVDGA